MKKCLEIRIEAATILEGHQIVKAIIHQRVLNIQKLVF